jgi:signal transduction histidine kinase
VREAVGHVPAGSADVTLQLAEDVPPLHVDALAMRRILENLVSNAVESLGGQSGIVTVSTSGITADGGRAARLVVEDTGKGMTERELERAFEDFYTTKPTGTGLGLSVVRRLVTDAKGRLRVETSPGAGSRFIVEIPVDEGGA